MEKQLETLRSAGQRMFSIGTSILQLKSGKKGTGPQRLRKSFRRAVKGFLACLAVSQCLAGDYPILVNTNMASNFGDLIVWRSFIEPQQMTFTVTNWSDPVPVAGTNGTIRMFQVAHIYTNRSVKFTFEGKQLTNLVDHERGPMVGMREIPAPLNRR